MAAEGDIGGLDLTNDDKELRSIFIDKAGGLRKTFDR